MADLTTLLKRIRSGEVSGLLEDVKILLSSCSGTVESQQVIRHCSRYIYEQPSVSEAIFLCVVDLIVMCCKHQQGQSVADPSFHLKSMYYIILMASKRKDLHQYLCVLLSDLDSYINSCDAANGDTYSIVKNLYQSVWNASLAVESSLQALTLQQYSLIFLLATGANVTKVCDQAMKILLNYEHVNKSLANAQDFCLAIITSLTKAIKKKSSFGGEIVLSIIQLVLQYAKSLAICGKCAEFSKTTRPLVSLLEGGCDQKTVLALKVGLKLTEVGMALKVGKCQEEMMVKFIQSCSMVPDATLSNSIMLLSLLYTTAFFETQNKKDVGYSLSPNVLGSIVDNILARCTSPVSDDNAKKVTTVLCQQLGGYVDMLKTTQDQNDVLKKALPWTLKTRSFITTHCSEKPDTCWQIYNVGVNTGNLGVLAFKGCSYDLAATFLETSVEMLSIYSATVAEDQKTSVNLSLHKKLVLWSDALRYNGNHWEAAVAASRGMLMGHISVDETVAIWVKCKRDAEKTENKRLRGLTICDVVRDARTKYKVSDDITFDSFAALQCEIVNYKKQSHDTAEDQLSCGRTMLECVKDVEGKINGYLMVAEALWIQPSLASQKDESLQAVKKAITLIAETKSKDHCTNRLQELEALSYFWLYLCHLQQIQDAATAEVQDAGKPVSLSVQATDLGEEVQVDDSCDVRPTPTCLTLHAQETSLAFLHVALSIWEKLDTKGVSLEETSICFSSLTSAGYVYQLSGLVNPTVRSWAVLVSLARKHSNKIYFIKGVTELLLVVPELISCELVKEVKTVLESCQGGETQDSSLIYMSLSLTAAIAYYYLKNGQYKEGGDYLQEALNNEIMAKRTIRATEIQALVHYVASLYAWLPPWVMESDHRPTQPCLSLAMLACRQAMAVLKSSVPTSNDVLCWRHRIGWLHLTTTLWLGHLCWASAQPRLARAYLKQSLTLTQELALPLRTGELLELLACVDLLCDQLEDCLVKVDSILGLLVVHPSNIQAYTPMTKKPEILLNDAPPNSKDQAAFQIFSNPENSEEESIRACSNGHEYDLKSVSFNTGLIVIGPPERVGQLALPQAPPSPSLRYREEASIVQVESCPQGEAKCVVCSTPTVHKLRMSAAVLLAYIHAHKGNFRPSKKNLCTFTEIFDAISQKTSPICNHIMSSINNKWKNKNKSSSRFIQSKLNLVHLRSFHCQAELFVLEDDLEEAVSANVQALKTINSLDNQLLLQDLQFVTTIILQRYALQRALDLKENEISNADKGKMEVLEQCESDSDEVTVIAFKTPARHLGKCLRKPSIRTSHRLPRKSTAPVKGKNYISSSDDDDDRGEQENSLKAPSRLGKQSTKTNDKPTPASTGCHKLSNTSARKQNLDVDAVGNQLSNLNIDKSPSRSVLKVPNALVVSPCSTSKPCSKGVENMCADDFKDIDTKRLTKPNTERKKRGTRKVQETATPTVLIFSDKDSPNSGAVCADDVQDSEKGELKLTRGRSRKTSEDKNVKADCTKAAVSLSKTKTVSDTKTRPKTRSSRTIR